MAFGTQDSQALHAAQAAGIRTSGFEIVDTSHMLQTLICPPHLSVANPEIILRNAIEACDRWAPNVTVCIEVESGNVVPDYVIDGVELLAADCYPANVIVVCNGASTHSPGNLLSGRLQSAVLKASPGGMLWHPIAKCLVRL